MSWFQQVKFTTAAEVRKKLVGRTEGEGIVILMDEHQVNPGADSKVVVEKLQETVFGSERADMCVIMFVEFSAPAKEWVFKSIRLVQLLRSPGFSIIKEFPRMNISCIS